MTTRAASAPGKLVVAGEYAVLYGHVAVVAAVDRRVYASLAGDGPLTVAGLGRGPWPVVVDEGRARVDNDDEGIFSLVAAVLDAALARGLALPRGALTIDSSSMNAATSGATRKLGLGSSAAVAASVSALCLGSAGPDGVFALAWDAHLTWSGGRGSGIDVAASCFGGLSRFRRTDDVVEAAPAAPVPADVDVIVVDTGRSQDTRSFVGAVNDLARTDENAHASRIGNIAAAAQGFIDACDRGASDDVIARVDEALAAMAALGEAAGIDIVSREHRAIADLARAHGGAAKPSGAGGGDVALAFVPRARAAAFRTASVAAGFAVVDLEVGAPGVRLEGA